MIAACSGLGGASPRAAFLSANVTGDAKACSILVWCSGDSLTVDSLQVSSTDWGEPIDSAGALTR